MVSVDNRRQRILSIPQSLKEFLTGKLEHGNLSADLKLLPTAKLKKLISELEDFIPKIGELLDSANTPQGESLPENLQGHLKDILWLKDVAQLILELAEHRLMIVLESEPGGGTQNPRQKHPIGPHGEHPGVVDNVVVKTARTLPDIQGLSSFQTQRVRAFLNDWMNSGQPMDLPILRNRLVNVLPTEIVNRLTTPELERIARTETLYAHNQRRVEQVKEHHGKEAIKEKRWHWVTAHDNRVCQFCNAVENGGPAPWKGKFLHFSGNPYKLNELQKMDDLHRLSGHPNCRCNTEYKPALLEKSLNLEKSDRFISGFASVEVVDSQGDRILIDGLKESVDWFKENTPYLHLEHESIPIGQIAEIEFKTHESGLEGLWIRCQLFKGYDIHNQVWDFVKAGKFKGFSIRGKGHREYKTCSGKLCQRIVPQFDLLEISLTESPANPLALLDEQMSMFEKCLA